ncbi:MAG: ABC transporter ATP-binding protein, partial [Myxococcota bacterium]
MWRFARRLLSWFEARIDPFPSAPARQAPSGLFAFCWHYTRPILPSILAMSALSAIYAVIEVSLFAFIGDLVDRLASADRATFWSDHGPSLTGWSLLMLVGVPGIGLASSLVLFQSVMGNFPMRIRWLSHRWILGQSQAFFADEMAGRVSTKVMQTALAVREAVTKLLDVLLYVVLYFLGGLYLMASADLRLVLPMLVWLGLYIAAMTFFLPRLSKVTEEQADARSVMTGRIVDSYTNIATVKLFAHSAREEQHAKDGMGSFLETVHAQMRLVTGVQFTLYTLNGFVLFAVAATSVGLWLGESISLGAITVAVGLALRLEGMSQWILWEMSALFENIGTISDGMSTLTKARSVVDAPAAPSLSVDRGEVRFETVRFHYGKGKGVIENLDLHIEAGEKVGLVGRSGAGKSTLVNLLLRFYDLEGGRITVDAQDISKVTQDSLRSQIGMVTQDTALLHRSVRDNVLYGRPDATEVELREALARAHADSFIPDLVDPKGRTGL